MDYQQKLQRLREEYRLTTDPVLKTVIKHRATVLKWAEEIRQKNTAAQPQKSLSMEEVQQIMV